MNNVIRLRDRTALLPPLPTYTPDDRDLKAARDTGREQGFIAGWVACSFVVTVLIVIFVYALGV